MKLQILFYSVSRCLCLESTRGFNLGLISFMILRTRRSREESIKHIPNYDLYFAKYASEATPDFLSVTQPLPQQIRLDS